MAKKKPDKKISPKDIWRVVTMTNKIVAQILELQKDQQRNYQIWRLEFEKRLKKISGEIDNRLGNHAEKLLEVINICELLDESLGNIYLAIRQNEYLQAYYPKQLGFDAQKVVGLHPAKIKPSAKKGLKN